MGYGDKLDWVMKAERTSEMGRFDKERKNAMSDLDGEKMCKYC